MNVLFLGLVNYQSIDSRGIYTDLLRVFIANGHDVYIVTSLGANVSDDYQLTEEPHSKILRVKTGKITKTNFIKKGINTVLLEGRYIKAIDRFFSDVKFDLVLYPTPPITLLNVVKHIKKRDGAVSYLMLKDIFPQNAVDIGMMSRKGIKGMIYKYFRGKEKRLYMISDHIGCMSRANVEYLRKHNPEVDPAKVEICPNSTDIEDKSTNERERREIRDKYGIPQEKTVFIYGGNLGKPQGIPFLIECMRSVKDVEDAFFLVVGSGTEYRRIEEYENSSSQTNFKLMQHLPKDDYDAMVGACDVGMIFLDHRFTIPNFPSRLLSYMSAKLPVLAVTDPNTDVGEVVTEGGFGWWCESNDADRFAKTVRRIMKEDRSSMHDTEFEYLKDHYSSQQAYEIIKKSINWE